MAGEAINLSLQHISRAHWPGIIMKAEAAGRPGDLAPPRQYRDRIGVGVDSELIIARALTQSVERSSSEKLRAPHHSCEVADRYGFRFRNSVEVDIGRQAMFDALFSKLASECCDVLRGWPFLPLSTRPMRPLRLASFIKVASLVFHASNGRPLKNASKLGCPASVMFRDCHQGSFSSWPPANRPSGDPLGVCGVALGEDDAEC